MPASRMQAHFLNRQLHALRNAKAPALQISMKRSSPKNVLHLSHRLVFCIHFDFISARQRLWEELMALPRMTADHRPRSLGGAKA